MDILTEVLDALQVEATEVRRLAGPGAHAEEVERGKATMVIVGEGRFVATAGAKRYELVRNDYLLLVGRQTLELAPQPSGTLIRSAFSLLADLPHPLARELPAAVHSGGRLIDRAELGRRLALLDTELVNSPPGTAFVAKRLAEVVLVDVLRSRQLETEPSFLAALADASVRASLEGIHREPRRAWRVEDLAAASGLSRAAFAERFHRLVGEPPLRYLRSWRLLNARRDLVRGGAAVAAVAARAGYRSANGFGRAFRRFFGESPSAARGATASRTRIATSG